MNFTAPRFVGIVSMPHSSALSFGTLIFCAPELFDKKGPPKCIARALIDSLRASNNLTRFSPLSDIYAFGMFLYEVMTHRFPFEQFVTESPDGSQLSNSRQHWSIGDIHKPGCNVALASRIIRQANLCITDSIRRETPLGYVDLLKKCIAVRPCACCCRFVSSDFRAFAVQPIGTPSFHG